jgi:hypothetical protein
MLSFVTEVDPSFFFVRRVVGLAVRVAVSSTRACGAAAFSHACAADD